MNCINNLEIKKQLTVFFGNLEDTFNCCWVFKLNFIMFDSVGKNHMISLVVALLLTISVDFVRSAPKDKLDLMDLIILHNNDMHSKFKEYEGMGGFARTSHVIKEHRKTAKSKRGTPVIYLNAGDNYIGSRWFNLFKDKVITDFMKVLNPDVMCLGNHEFDHGIGALVPFLEKAKFPIVFANYKGKANDPLRKAKVIPSVVLKVNGYRIGVIGYLTPETGHGIDYTDEIMAVNEETKKLKKHGVKTIIALGHSGFKRDLEIAANCSQIDLVVGGHTHTFLYSGEQPDEEEIHSPYPTEVKQETGKIIPVIQAFWATKYLGKLEITVDKNTGRLTKWGGNPILMNGDIPEDPEITALEKKYQKMEDKIAGPPFAESELELDNFRCRILECGLGNLITDSFIVAAKAKLDDASFAPTAAIITSGNIRSKIFAGNINQLDVKDVLPFPSDLVIMKITGEKLMKAFEHSVVEYVEHEFIASFLQMSGFRVVFDVALKPGSRVLSVEIRNSQNLYEKLNLQKVYNVVTSEWLMKKGDGFTMFKDCEAKYLQIPILDALTNHIKKSKVLNPSPVHEGRITVHNVFPLKKGVPPLHDNN